MTLRLASSFLPIARSGARSLAHGSNGIARSAISQATARRGLTQAYAQSPALHHFEPIIQQGLQQGRQATVWIRNHVNAGLAILGQNPSINRLMQRFAPQLEAVKEASFRNWETLSNGFQKIGEAFGFVSDAQLRRVYEPMRMIYKDQVSNIKRELAFDIGSGILGVAVASVKPISVLMGAELPLMVAVPTISAGMSMMSRGVGGFLTKRTSLAHAQAGLKRLTRITGG